MRVDRHIVCFGASSEIAAAYLKLRAAPASVRFTLVGRDRERLEAVGERLQGAAYDIVLCDFADRQASRDVCKQIVGPIDEALVAFALLKNQTRVGEDQDSIAAQLDVNFTNSALLVEALAQRLGQQAEPSRLIVIGSTAADRARPVNYAYGASKAALEFFCDGVRYQLKGSGVRFTFVKPGLTDSAMTRAANRPAKLMCPPERVAGDIARAVDRGQVVVYTPWHWRWVTLLGRLLPRPVIARLRV